MTTETRMRDAVLQFRTAAMRHADALATCLDAWHASPPSQLPEAFGCNWAWSDRAREAYINAGGLDAFNAANISIAEADTENPTMRMAHGEIYRQKGGIRANLLAVQAFIKSNAGYVNGPMGAGWRRERRAANRLLRKTAKAWFDLLETMPFLDAIDALDAVYRQVGDDHGFARAEMLNALGINELMGIACIHHQVEQDEELTHHLKAQLGFWLCREGQPDWVDDNLAAASVRAAQEWIQEYHATLR